MTHSCILEHQLRCDTFFTTVIFQWNSDSDLWVTDVEGERMCFNQLWMCLVMVYLKEKGEEAYASSAAPNCPRACHDSQTENRRGKKKKSHQQVCVTPHCSCSITTIQIIVRWMPIIEATAGVQCNMQCHR